MKVVNIANAKNSDSLVDSPMPEPKDGEVLVKIYAVGVNHVDLLWADQKVKPDDTVLGLEMAGEVIDGNNTTYNVGTRVMGLIDNGGYAEYIAVSADRLMLIPDNIDYKFAATIPESFLTAYQTLFTIGNLQGNQTVLIHAGASGVGTAAIQLVKQLTKATVITTSSTKKTEICLRYGADYAIDYRTENFAEEVQRITDGHGADLILDFIGASYYQQNIQSVAMDGQIILIGNLGGSEIKDVNIMDIIGKRISITGTLLSTRSDEYKARLISDFSNDVYDLLACDKIKIHVSNEFDLSQSKDALSCMREKQNTGKIILNVK
ncbi:Phthiocerol synthesis polyketide synthase type I PpsC [Apilactobacillus kunkeei]|nr:Phthiocerol synthesis polyketide synthase type I PpsC [Apilactobacillus kunkeei]CAI2579303.1 Phthiocerol synthesis polyketide synthase type I PpsC [Apilactobacillus kunkeei]CAI2801700.1 Phthiocerol synthesis polyketide synthase type I PpsC [Apilactobacillus kunkeei]